MRYLVAFLCVIMLPAQEPDNTAGELQLRLQVPAGIRFGQPLRVEFQVTNAGPVGVYFKRPWKWAPNGLYVRAVAESGSVIASETLLYDIRADTLCTHFKPIGPGESFAFRVDLAACEGCPALPLPTPGRYRLQWVYEPKHYEDEASCAAGGWATWKGRGESPEVELVVQ